MTFVRTCNNILDDVNPSALSLWILILQNPQLLLPQLWVIPEKIPDKIVRLTAAIVEPIDSQAHQISFYAIKYYTKIFPASHLEGMVKPE